MLCDQILDGFSKAFAAGALEVKTDHGLCFIPFMDVFGSDFKDLLSPGHHYVNLVSLTYHYSVVLLSIG